MKRFLPYLLSLFALSLLVLPCRAFALFGLEAGIGYWKQSPSGSFAYKGDDLDLKDVLNFSDESRLIARVKVELPLILPNIYFMATPMSFEGDGSITRGITFGDTSFDITAPIESKLKLDHYDLALFYPIPFLKTATAGKLNVEVGLNARKIDFEGTISQPTLNKSSSKSKTLYAPLIYAGVQVNPVDFIAIEAEARGVAYGSNHYYDFIGRVKGKPIPLVFVAAGYRSETLKIDQNDVNVDIRFNGPFIEAGVSF